MKIEIVTPDSTIYEGEISLAQFPGLDGSFEVLNNHAPMIAALKKGKVKVIDAKKATLFFEINGGVVEILKNKIQVLAE
jgi:F-type H+-transporting ATPase subunit epsilon